VQNADLNARPARVRCIWRNWLSPVSSGPVRITKPQRDTIGERSLPPEAYSLSLTLGDGSLVVRQPSATIRRETLAQETLAFALFSGEYRDP